MQPHLSERYELSILHIERHRTAVAPSRATTSTVDLLTHIHYNIAALCIVFLNSHMYLAIFRGPREKEATDWIRPVQTYLLYGKHLYRSGNLEWPRSTATEIPNNCIDGPPDSPGAEGRSWWYYLGGNEADETTRRKSCRKWSSKGWLTDLFLMVRTWHASGMVSVWC